MILHVPNVLNSEQVARCCEVIMQSKWVDGRVTAGHLSALVKNNLQLPEDSTEARELGEMILGALEHQPLFISAALPYRVFPPMFSRYDAGMSLGTHLDNAVRPVLGTPFRIRTDLAATLFLSQPNEYDGGELVIDDVYGAHAVKLSAGAMVLYSATSLHRVTPVRRGTRLTCIFWVQSMVRDESQRRLLFDLDMAINQINQALPNHAAVVALTYRRCVSRASRQMTTFWSRIFGRTHFIGRLTTRRAPRPARSWQSPSELPTRGSPRHACLARRGMHTAHRADCPTRNYTDRRVTEEPAWFRLLQAHITAVYANDTAVQLFRDGRLDAAIAELRRGLDVNPRYATGYSNLGFLYLRRGELEQAVDSLLPALALDPLHKDAADHLHDVLRAMTDELVQIGLTDGFLATRCGGAFDDNLRHRRARHGHLYRPDGVQRCLQGRWSCAGERLAAGPCHQ